MSEADIEREIQAKGLNAPRLTPAMIDRAIVDEVFHVFPGTTVTICALTLRNGFVVVGKAAAASAANFDEEIGRRVARDDARDQIWALEGYRLREFLAKGGLIEQHLFKFAGWLTSRAEPITFSAAHDAAPVAHVVQEFIDRFMTSGSA